MRDWFPALLKSLGLHGLLMVALLLRWGGPPASPPAPDPPEIIEAVAVDEAEVRQELQRLHAREEAEARQRERLTRQRQVEERRIRELKRRQLEEKKRLRELAEAKRKKAREEALRLAELKKRQREEAERLKKLEQARKEAERRRSEAEKRRREEKRRQEAARKKAAAERRAREHAREVQRQVSAATARIQRQVERFWLRPPTYRAGLSCTIQVHLNRGGEVVRVRIVRSSGDLLFDRSAEVAVRKASPLPVPDDPVVAAKFRTFNFLFKPEG